MNIPRIHPFQQASEFVHLISFKYNGKISILTLSLRVAGPEDKRNMCPTQRFRLCFLILLSPQRLQTATIARIRIEDTKELVFGLARYE